ncbi:hypothetical protein [Sphingobium yanoikuyae]|uniref:hypothetical protein n=1 Tax=Sphingobium yanoikuyae TaxID=13690 RepID=UPI0035C76273
MAGSDHFWPSTPFQTCPIADRLFMCSIPAMRRSRNLIAAVAVAFATALLSGCTSPISDPGKLRAIESEARSLMVDYPVSSPSGWIDISKRRWPPKMASLKPEAVAVHDWGIDIMMKPGLDGGYGYAIAQSQKDLPMPAKCYSELRQGVFWHIPC